MTPWLFAVALAAPVADQAPVDPMERCAEAAGPVRTPETLVPGERIALVIGIACHRDPRVPSLGLAGDDAARMGEALGRRGFTVAHLTTVADRRAVLEALDAAIAAVQRDGELVVYLSGHGVLRQQGATLERFLVTSDTRLADLPDTAIPVRTIEARLAEVDAARRVLISDTCFAAQPVLAEAPADGFARRSVPIAAAPVPAAPGELRLYAARFFEEAVESPELGGGLYTHHFLDALDAPEADLDGNRCVDALEAHTFATPTVDRVREGFQHPVADWRQLTELQGTLGCALPPAHAITGHPDRTEAHLDGEPLATLDRLGPGAHELRVLPARRRVRIDGNTPGWHDLSSALDARAPWVALRAGPSSRWHPSLPAAGVDLVATWASPLLAGPTAHVDLAASLQPLQTSATPCLAYAAQAAHLTGGLWAGSLVAIGPSLGIGVRHRTPRNDCTAAPLADGWGTELRTALDARVALGDHLAIHVDGGVDALWIERTALALEPVPWARVALALRARAVDVD